MKEIWIEDFESQFSEKYTYSLANFTSNIKNLQVKKGQGDHMVKYISNLQDNLPGTITDYNLIEKLGTYHRNITLISENANWILKNNPMLELDYKIPVNSNLSIGVQMTNGYSYLLPTTIKQGAQRLMSPAILNLKNDENWYHASINLYDLIGQRDFTVKKIWIEDFESQASEKYTYSLANFSSHIQNILMKKGQGDHMVKYISNLQDNPAGTITDYNLIEKLGTYHRNIISISENANWILKNNPMLELDYKIPVNSNLSIGVQMTNGYSYLLPTTIKQGTQRLMSPAILNLKNDENWYHASINLYDLIGQRDFTVKKIWIEDFESQASEKYTYSLANFSSHIQNLNIRKTQGDYQVSQKIN